jgi:hypothetical protein
VYGGQDANDSVMRQEVMSLFLLASIEFSSQTIVKTKELRMSMEHYPTSCGMLSDSNLV